MPLPLLAQRFGLALLFDGFEVVFEVEVGLGIAVKVGSGFEVGVGFEVEFGFGFDVEFGSELEFEFGFEFKVEFEVEFGFDVEVPPIWTVFGNDVRLSNRRDRTREPKKRLKR